MDPRFQAPTRVPALPPEKDTLLHDRYKIIRPLGKGGMGAVYYAHDESLDVHVAIKENLFVSVEAERQFRREAKLLATIRHPHLPRVTDHFVVPGQSQYLVMDFIPGDDLQKQLSSRTDPFAESEALRWTQQILDGLVYLHTRPEPIIHRDIKPANIKITPEGTAVLVDFGIAKVYDPDQSTTVGAKGFTPGYAPPEQYGMGRTSVHSDIYALGATLYALLTWKIPADSLERAMGEVELVPVREFNPAISPQIAAAVERAMSIQKDDRFESAAAFAAALKPEKTVSAPAAETTVASSGREGSSSKTLARPERGTPGRKRSRLILIALGLLALGGAAIFAGWGGLSVTEDVGRRAGLLLAPPTDTPTSEPTRSATPVPSIPPASPTSVSALVREATPTPSASPTPAPTPRGGGPGQIAFVSERAGVPQIFLISSNGEDIEQLTNLPDGACQPAWSPGGDSLLFISPCDGKDDTYPRAVIFLFSLESASIRTAVSMVGGAFDPDWSAPGIVFTRWQNNQARLWLAPSPGAEPSQLSPSNAADRQASWSPDGERLVFMNTSRAGSQTLYWMFADGTFPGSNPDQVSRNLLARSPDWSPLGNLIAFVASPHVYVVPWDSRGFQAVQVTSKGPNADPDWSPDGQWMTFESWREAANHDIYIMTANGAMQTRLTDHSAADYQPAWRP